MQRTIDGQLVPVLETDEQRAARAHDLKVEEAIRGVNATAHVVLKATSVALDVDMALSGVGMLRGLGAGAFRSGALDAALDKSLAEEAAQQSEEEFVTVYRGTNSPPNYRSTQKRDIS